MTRAWWQKPFRMFQTNLRLIDAGMDADAVAQQVQEHGVDAWLVNTGGIYSSFPSRLASQTPNPFLHERPSGDLVDDALQAAHSRGLKFMARMDFSKVLKAQADQHPDWLFVSHEGEQQVFNDLVTTCPSGRYFQEETFRILDEVMERYPVDGYFFNWFNYSEFNYAYTYIGPCHCAPCTEGFEGSTGLTLPKLPTDENYTAWQAWSDGMLLDLGQRISDHIHAQLPDAALILSDASDLRYEEANNGVGREPWRFQTAETVSSAFTHLPDVPVLTNCVSFLDFPYRMGEEEPERFAQYLIQAMSRGSSISTYIMGYPGRITYPSLPLAGEITRYHRDAQDWYEGLRQDSPVLLVSPGLYYGMTEMSHAVSEFRGLYEALVAEHIPFDVLPSKHLHAIDPARLAGYTLVALPNLGELDAAAVALVDAYVEAGGRLLATGDSGVAKDGTVQLASLGAARVVETRSGRQLLSAYVQREGGRVVPLHGEFHAVSLQDGVATRARYMAPAPFGPPEYCYGHEASDEPGVVLSTHGAGTAAYLPWTVGKAFYVIGTSNLREHLAEVLAELVPQGFGVATDLPTAVEVVRGRADKGTLIHLISDLHATRASYAEPVELRGHTLRIAGHAGQRATSLVHGTELSAVDHDGDLIVTLEPLLRFDAIALEEK